MDEINMLSSVIHTVINASGLMLTDDFRISQKDGAANIVTSSDIAVQEFLCRRLSDLLPGCGFLCEEEDMHDLLHEYTWIINPIDGTANYSRGIRECAICVGLKHGAVMELAVVYLPGPTNSSPLSAARVPSCIIRKAAGRLCPFMCPTVRSQTVSCVRPWLSITRNMLRYVPTLSGMYSYSVTISVGSERLLPNSVIWLWAVVNFTSSTFFRLGILLPLR